MLKTMKCCLLSAIILIASPIGYALDFSRTGDTVLLEGGIQPGDYAKFLAVAQGASSVVITASTGGDAQEALRIAEFIETAKMSVRVSGSCASACASILLVAGASRQIDEHGLLLFHSGTAGLVAKMVADLESMPESARKLPFYTAAINQPGYLKTRDLLLELRAFYVRRGVSLEAMRNMEYAIPDPGGYLGVAMNKERHFTPMDLRIKNAKCRLWAPDENALREIGIRLDTPYSPDTKQLTIKPDGRAELNNGVPVYLGSIFDAERIRTQCDVTMPGRKPA